MSEVAAEAPAPTSEPAPAPQAEAQPAGDERGLPKAKSDPQQAKRERDKGIDRKLAEALKTGKVPDDEDGKPKAKKEPAEPRGEAKTPKEDKPPAKAKEQPAEPDRATAKEKQPPDPKTDDKPDPKPTEGKKPASEPPKVEAKPKPEVDHNERLREAKRMREHAEALSRAETEKREREKVSAEYEKTKQEIARRDEQVKRWKANPLEFLSEANIPFPELVKGINEGKFKPSTPRAELPPEVREELEALKQWRAQQEEIETRRQQAEQEAARKRERDEHVATLKSWLEENADEYPIVASIDWAPGTIIDNTLNSGQSDVKPQMEGLEKAIRDTTLSLLGNERVLSALIASKPELRDTIAAAIGGTNSANPPASHEGGNGSEDTPRSIGSLPTGPSSTPKPGTPEFYADIDRKLKEAMSKGVPAF